MDNNYHTYSFINDEGVATWAITHKEETDKEILLNRDEAYGVLRSLVYDFCQSKEFEREMEILGFVMKCAIQEEVDGTINERMEEISRGWKIKDGKPYRFFPKFEVGDRVIINTDGSKRGFTGRIDKIGECITILGEGEFSGKYAKCYPGDIIRVEEIE